MKKKVVVLGSGPIRIGQGIEFDYCSVHCVWALRESDCEAIIINNNPETVSTDFDTSDRLYFEPLTLRRCAQRSRPRIRRASATCPASSCSSAGRRQSIWRVLSPTPESPILGTSADSIDLAEDREQFERTAQRELNIPKPAGRAVVTSAGGRRPSRAGDRLSLFGAPVVSCLGGRAMEIVYSRGRTACSYMRYAVDVSPKAPRFLVDRYIMGKEVEVDCICDGDRRALIARHHGAYRTRRAFTAAIRWRFIPRKAVQPNHQRQNGGLRRSTCSKPCTSSV